MLLGGLLLAAIIVAVVVHLWLGGRPGVIKLPDIQIDGLEGSVVEVIHRHMAIVQTNQLSGPAWGKLGAILKAFNFRDQAAYCLAEAERLDPTEPRWPYLQGVLTAVDATSVAEAKFRRAVALCGNTPEMPRLRLARLLAEGGRAEEAEQELKQLLAAKPDCGPARVLMARLKEMGGRFDEAIALTASCTTNPYTARAAWTLLSALHLRQGDTNAAERASRRATAVTRDVAWPDPFEDEVMTWRNDVRTLSDRAQGYLMAGRVNEALPLVNQLVRDYPAHPETWLLQGRLQNLQNHPGAAEQALRRYLQMESNSVNGQFQLGMSLMQQKRYPEAAVVFRQVTTLKQDFGPSFFNWAFALVKAGHLREAVEPFQEAIRQNPEKIDSYILLSDLFLQLGEKRSALELAALAEKLDPTDPRVAALRRKLAEK